MSIFGKEYENFDDMITNLWESNLLNIQEKNSFDDFYYYLRANKVPQESSIRLGLDSNIKYTDMDNCYNLQELKSNYGEFEKIKFDYFNLDLEIKNFYDNIYSLFKNIIDEFKNCNDLFNIKNNSFLVKQELNTSYSMITNERKTISYSFSFVDIVNRINLDFYCSFYNGHFTQGIIINNKSYNINIEDITKYILYLLTLNENIYLNYITSTMNIEDIKELKNINEMVNI